ncbi:MAG: hypothetical protein BWY74_04494 [Firmicutes bacterium ADurb.Bin419]|nr:MAG: hypothetical protein BWY74_04494 [Firmicutes bacterium ADurb.Bin419]
MAVVSNFHFETFTDINMKFSTSLHKDDFIELNARIIRESTSEGYYEYGLLILRMDNKNSEKISTLIDQLDKHQISLIEL